MAKKPDRPRFRPKPEPTAQQPRDTIDSGGTGDKVAFHDPVAAPLGSDVEASGAPPEASRVAAAIREEVRELRNEPPSQLSASPAGPGAGWPRPVSPNIQIYRPQLTSVLSIAHRITGALLSLGGLGLVVWLLAAASGPSAYAVVRGAISSLPGQIVLVGLTFAFFLHLCGGIRHLAWDTVHGFELRAIYASGWSVLIASVMLTIAAWIASLMMVG